MCIKFCIQPAAAGEGVKRDEPEYGLVHVVIDSGVYIGEPPSEDFGSIRVGSKSIHRYHCWNRLSNYLSDLTSYQF